MNFQQLLASRAVVELAGLVVPATGNLLFTIRDGENVKASWTVSVVQIGPIPTQFNVPAPYFSTAGVGAPGVTVTGR